MAATGVTLGFSVHTGWAAVVAVGGPPLAPEIVGKTRIDVASTFDEGAVYHVARERPPRDAEAFIQDMEVRFVERARVGLSAFRDGLAGEAVAAGMVAPPERRWPSVEKILGSHPLVHAAEGELYRRVFAEASAALGIPPVRVAAGELTRRLAHALALPSSEIEARLAAIGKASGRPWAADQKQAALVAWAISAER